MKTCLEINDMAFPIKLEQYKGKNEFIVTYGLQIRPNLTYSQAATELGTAIMHALKCDSKIEHYLKY